MGAKYIYHTLLILSSFSITANSAPDIQEKLSNIIEEIYQKESAFNNEIKNDPLFFEQGQFESSSTYRTRMDKAQRKIRKLRKQYFTDLFIEYGSLKEKQFTPICIDSIDISLGEYDADEELYEIILPQLYLEEDNHRLYLPVKREMAETLFNSWDEFEKKGFQITDSFEENSLVRLLLHHHDAENAINYTIKRSILTLPVSIDVEYNKVQAIKNIVFHDGILHFFGEPSRVSSYVIETKTMINVDLPTNGISVFTYSRDLSKYAIGINDTIIVASTDTNHKLFSFPQLQYHNVSSLDFSKEGKYLLAGTLRGDVVIYDLTTGESIYAYVKTTDDAILSAKFSSDSELIAFGWDKYISSTLGGGGAEVIRWRSDSTLYYFEHEYGVSSVSFSNYKNLLGTGGKKGLKVFDLNSGTLVASANRNNVNTIIFSPDDLFIVIGNGDLFNLYSGFGISLFNRMTGNFVPFGDVPQPVQSLVYSQDGLYIVAGCYGGNSHVFRALY